MEGSTWFSHQQKRCIHKEIFEKASENRDFILSLPPNLVYYLSNLWDPENKKDPKAKQWENYLGELKKYFKDEDLDGVCDKWKKLIRLYLSQKNE